MWALNQSSPKRNGQICKKKHYEEFENKQQFVRIISELHHTKLLIQSRPWVYLISVQVTDPRFQRLRISSSLNGDLLRIKHCHYETMK